MKKFLKILAILGGLAVVLIIAGLVYFNFTFPKAEGPMNVKVEVTPERISRGEYLANHITACMDCHSQRDWSKFSGPITPGTLGMGGDIFNEDMGFPGTVSAKNITPAGIGHWTDGEIIRLVTQGVNKDNNVIFPLMPFPLYNNLSEEDMYSIVAYIRSLKPIENTVPETKLNFPLNFIVKTMAMESYKPVKEVDKSDVINYGKYLSTIGGCIECHTLSDKGVPQPGMDFAGGMEFNLPGGLVKSANLTPHEETGLGKWTKEDFINRFKFYAIDSNIVSTKMTDFNTPMPWTMYAGMTEEDLGVIYEFLRSVRSVDHFIERFTPHKTVASK